MKTVQVLMSTYNGEEYLEEQIQSILKQKKVKVRLLVRDDGSSDSTLEILEKYKRANKLQYIKGTNLGYSKSFIKLLRISEKADYYAYADQDDVWLDDKLITGIRRLNDCQKPSLYCSALQRVDSNLNLMNIQDYSSLSLNLGSLLSRGRLAGCTFIFNYELKKYIDMLNTNSVLYSHDGWTILSCLALKGFVYFDKTPHILFRRHVNNASIDEGGIYRRIKHEFRFFGKNKNQRHEVAKVLYATYKNYLDKEEQDILLNIINYKTSFFATIKLCADKRIKSGIFFSDLITRLIILCRCY